MTAFTPQSLLLIINPASGKDEAILSHVSAVLQPSEIRWRVAVTQGDGDATRAIREADDVDAVAVYGGDGTVAEAVRAMYGNDIPLLILRGGTGNVLAHEIGLGRPAKEVLEALVAGKCGVRRIDVGVCNDVPFVVTVMLDAPAEAIGQASRELKNVLGKAAYLANAAQKIVGETPRHTYRIVIDSQEQVEEGVGLIVANTGNMSLPGAKIAANIRVDDGLLDVIVIKHTNVAAIVGWLRAQADGTGLQGHFAHWQVTSAEVRVTTSRPMILDDSEAESGEALHIAIRPASLPVVVMREGV